MFNNCANISITKHAHYNFGKRFQESSYEFIRQLVRISEKATKSQTRKMRKFFKYREFHQTQQVPLLGPNMFCTVHNTIGFLIKALSKRNRFSVISVCNMEEI